MEKISSSGQVAGVELICGGKRDSLVNKSSTFEKQSDTQKTIFRKLLILAISLILNLSILFFFKYFNFTFSTIEKIAYMFGRDFVPLQFNVLLPVGISFYTFQALGYSIDVFRGTVKAERNFVTYALFVTFFPQLVAGPIERTERLLPQFKVDYKFDYGRVTDGLKLIAYGLFLKIVVADRISVFVDQIYEDVSGSSGLLLLFATFAFAIQIYSDFNGYSTIAVGTAQILGFRLMRNFERPYFAKSIPEFWRRWHISLSSWFRDYLYIPLGGNRFGKLKKYFNLLIVFFVSGLWHGAAWHFVAWGVMHGIYQVISFGTENFRKCIRIKLGLQAGNTVKRWWQIVQVGITFCMSSAAWIFFRANSLRDALRAGKRIFFLPCEIFGNISEIIKNGMVINFGKDELFNCVTLFFVAVLFVVDLSTRKKQGIEIVKEFSAPVRWFLYWLLVLAILFFQNFEQTEFLYFQF